MILTNEQALSVANMALELHNVCDEGSSLELRIGFARIEYNPNRKRTDQLIVTKIGAEESYRTLDQFEAAYNLHTTITNKA